MTANIILLAAVYVVGYFVWLGYALNRFISRHRLGDGEEVFHIFMALFWPLCVAGYAPYRIFLWLGVRRGC